MPAVADDVDEHPIIFNNWSINRILAGEKTQTRRIVKPQPPDDAGKLTIGSGGSTGGMVTPEAEAVYTIGIDNCPFGKPGARLWARETFRLPHDRNDISPREYIDEDWTCSDRPYKYEADGVEVGSRCVRWGRKRPSIHMPRELCRLRLRVEDVRVEKVQSITPEDAEAEGVDPKNALAPCSVMEISDPFRARFAQVWNDIHGDGAWERNDYVWVVEFSRINE